MSLPTAFSIQASDLNNLDPMGLTRLLRSLLYAESKANGIPANAVSAALNISVPDGGEDASVRWEGKPNRTEWFPSNDVLFQSKATNVTASVANQEVLTKDRNSVKPRVDQLFQRGGTYILICNVEKNGSQKSEIIEGMRSAFREVGSSYADDAHLVVYDASQIEAWTNTYPGVAMSARELVGRISLGAIKTWLRWSGESEMQNRYFKTEKIEQLHNDVQKVIATPKTTIRVEGFSGLGKTRFALETFRPEGEPDGIHNAFNLSQLVVYIDIGDSDGFADDIRKDVKTIVDEGLHAIIVVDNCPLRLHRQLSKEIKRSDSRASLMTLNYEPNPLESFEHRIELSPIDQKDIVKQIIEAACPGLDKTIVDRAAEFSEGFPKIAVMLGQSWQSNPDASGAISDSDLANRLLGTRIGEDDEKREIARTCSLFTQVGRKDEFSDELKFIGDLCHVPVHRVESVCNDLNQRGIADFAGRVFRVTPLPLALFLAAEWWERIRPEDVPEFLQKVKNAGMSDRLCNQLENLHYLSHSRDLVEKLCSSLGPFGHAEVLSTEWGSRLLLSFASVNNMAVAGAMMRSFGDMTTENLRSIEVARRNLVSTLERLAFWEDSFPFAAKLLLLFGAAENESWANNATGLFRQLFHVFLPGTLAPLDLRLAVLQEGVISKDPARRILALKGFSSALQSGHFSRSGGVERQGSRAPQQDYRPSPDEVIDYWRDCMSVLGDAACDSQTADLVRNEFGGKLGSILDTQAYPAAIKTALRIIECTGLPWAEGHQSTYWALHYRMPDAPAEQREAVEELHRSFTPKGLGERIASYVTQFDRTIILDDADVREENARLRLHGVAHETLENESDWTDIFAAVSTGAQINGVQFGVALGEIARQQGKEKAVMSAALEAFLNISAEDQNVSVVGGIVRSVGAKEKDQTMSILLERLVKMRQFVGFLGIVGIDNEDLGVLVLLAESDRLTPDDLSEIQWGCPIRGVGIEDITKFANGMADVEAFSAITLELLGSWKHCFNEDEFETEMSSTIRVLLGRTELLQEFITQPHRQMHWWLEAVKAVMELDDSELFESLTSSVLRVFLDREGAPVPYEVISALNLLLERHPSVSWPQVSDALLNDAWVSFRLSLWAGGSGFDDERENVITKSVPYSDLVEWVRANGADAAIVLGRIGKVFSFGDGPTWEPLIEFLLDEYGEDDRVLSAIGSNLYSFSSVGSRYPYYAARATLLRSVDSHPNRLVRAWANKQAEMFEEFARQSEMEDEEEAIGFFAR